MIRKSMLALLILLTFTSFREREVIWVAIGDSITYLNDHTEETGNRVKKGYLTRVIEKLPNVFYVNQGHNGWTSGRIAENIDKLDLVKGDVYSVFLGTNDWWGGRPVGKFADYKNGAGNTSLYGSFSIIIKKIRYLNPLAKIVLITPMQRNDFVYIADAKNNAYGSYRKNKGQSLEDFADAILQIGKYEGFPVIDLYHHPSLKIENLVNFKRLRDPGTDKYTNYSYPKSVNVPFDPITDEYPYPRTAMNITYDGLHPSDKGNAVIAEAVAATFRQIGLAPRWDEYINLKRYMQPFWKADTVVDESIQIIKDGRRAAAPLLFRAHKILSVKAANQSKAFKKGKDWNYKNGKIDIVPGSPVPLIEKKELVFKESKPGLSMPGRVAGRFVLFSENAYFSARQLLVTYIPDKRSKWNGPVTSYSDSGLAVTKGKLSAKKSLNIVFYGNSIEAGYNTSGLDDVPPYMPTWPELVVYKLRSTYGMQVNYINTSIPGKLAKWGLDSVGKRVIPYHPDLVVIGFGMNDGSSHVTPEQFREQVKGMMDSVSASNGKAEFILITPMLPNPDAIQSGLQSQYRTELLKLVRKGVVLADMTGVHAELLKYKHYQDMTGNNINHPNDYLARWYAQIICGLLGATN